MARDFLDDLSGDPDIVDIPNLKDVVDPGSPVVDPNIEVTPLSLSKALDTLSTEHQTLKSYHAVMEHIIGQGKISQADVKLAMSNIPELLGNKLVLEQFTLDRSDAFYEPFKKQLTYRIAQEETSVQTASVVFFEEQLEDMKTFFHHYQKYYRETIQTTLRTLITQHQCLLNCYQNSHDFVVPTEDGFVDILNESLYQFKKVKLKLEQGAAFAYDGQMSADGIYDLINEYRLVLLISGIKGNYDSSDYLNRLLSMDTVLEADVVSYKYFLDLLTSPKILSTFDDLETMLGQSIQTMEQLQSQLAQSSDSYLGFDKFLMDNHDQLKQVVMVFEFGHIVTKRLLMILPLLVKGLAFLSSLIVK